MAAVTQNVCVCVCVNIYTYTHIGTANRTRRWRGDEEEKMEERRCGKITGVEYYYVCRGTQSTYTHSAM